MRTKVTLQTHPLVFFNVCALAMSDGVLDDSSQVLWELMNELYDVRTKWKLIGLGLLFPESDLNAISATPQNSCQECLQKLLSNWLKRLEPLPTWNRLVAVLKSPVLSEEKKAQQLEERFCIPPKTESDTPPYTVDNVPTSLPATQPCPSPLHEHQISDQMSPSSISSADDVPLDGQPSLYSESEGGASNDDQLISSRCRPSLSSALERITDPEVSKKLKGKDFEFRSLIRTIHKYLSRTMTEPEDFADFKVAISFLPASKPGHHILLSPADCTEIIQAKSFDHIFIVLNQYWSPFEYELLEYVAMEYGSDCIKSKMNAYVDDMDKLEAEIGIDHVTAIHLCFPRPDSVSLDVHLSGMQHTLRNTRLVQRAMAEQCDLHPHTVRTYQTIPGSTILTLLIPYSVAGHVLALLCGTLPARELLSKPLEERRIYTMDEAETEMYLPFTVSETKEFPERAAREKEGSEDYLNIPSTGNVTVSKVSEDTMGGVVDEVLKSAILQKEKEMEELQDKLKAPTHDTTAVCILGSVSSLCNEAVIAQSPPDLSDSDCQQLVDLGVPSYLWDNLNALLAMYTKAEYSDVCSVHVSKPGMELSCNYVLQKIEFLLQNFKNTVIHYYGNGRKNTGDWCFKDGFITFRDIADLYMKYSLGRKLGIVTDCHSSGRWVGECAKFLDDHKVKPCGHSAKKKGILLKVLASCRTGQDTAELCYTARAMRLHDDGYIYHRYGKKLSGQQNTIGVESTKIRCKKEEEEECIIAPNSTWSTTGGVISWRKRIVREKNRGRPVWHYILLYDDAEKIKDYNHKMMGKNPGNINLRNYGTLLRLTRGKDPSQEDKDWFDNYGNP